MVLRLSVDGGDGGMMANLFRQPSPVISISFIGLSQQRIEGLIDPANLPAEEGHEISSHICHPFETIVQITRFLQYVIMIPHFKHSLQERNRLRERHWELKAGQVFSNQIS